jgi:adenylosuccinate synthase
LKKGKTAVIVGAQWGDEGKGKIVDVLSENFSVVARYAGGHNAGHTVIINGKKFILQLVPCGVLRSGCRSVIGNGVVLDPIAFLKEVAALRETGDPAIPSHDRTSFGKCSGARKDRHHFPRHRSDLRRQNGAARPARGGPA